MSTNKQEERNRILRKKMVDLQDVRIGEFPTDSPWIRPVRVYYTQDGEQKNWDVIKSHDSKDTVDVEKYPASLGLTLELCAGIVDKNKSLVEIAKDELREECGYEAPTSAFQQIVTYRYVSSAASKQTLFYVEVTDDMHIHPGGGAEAEGELIEVVELSVSEVKEYINSAEVQSPPCFLYGVSWFLANKQGS
ncbi:hypothetical protein KM043_009850 [Ampulex compressa]|nr:hypothetical protein KM043_009850 [Ampulex compressa]